MISLPRRTQQWACSVPRGLLRFTHMTRGACILVIGAYLAVGGLGFVEVSCLCAERESCILPIAEACVVQPDPCGDCDDEGCPSMSEASCPCGPCIDLLIASSLHMDLPSAEPGPIAIGAIEQVPLVPTSAELSVSSPSGPSPPRLPTRPILRC